MEEKKTAKSVLKGPSRVRLAVITTVVSVLGSVAFIGASLFANGGAEGKLKRTASWERYSMIQNMTDDVISGDITMDEYRENVVKLENASNKEILKEAGREDVLAQVKTEKKLKLLF